MTTEKEAMVNLGGKKYPIVSDDNYLEHIKNGFDPGMVKPVKMVAAPVLFTATVLHAV